MGDGEETKKGIILQTLVLGIVLSYLPWYNIAAVIGPMARDTGLTSGEVGTILSAFQLGYVITVLLTGCLGDALGEKRIIAASMFGLGLSSVLLALGARTYGTILFFRFCAGVSAGGIYVPGMALLTRWFPASERGKALGTFIGGLTASYALSYLITAPLAALLGWPLALLLTSLPALFVSFLVILRVEDGPREEKNIPPQALKGSLQAPALLTASYMGHMWELYAFWGWIGLFMENAVRARGLEGPWAMSLAGIMAAAIIFIGAFGVRFLGAFSDRWGRTATIMVCGVASALGQFFLGFLLGQSLALILCLGLWIGFWIIADSSCFSAGLSELTPAAIRGRALALQNGLGFSMTVFSPYVFGRVLELGGMMEQGESVAWGLPFVVLGLGALLAPGAALLLRGHPMSHVMAQGKK